MQITPSGENFYRVNLLISRLSRRSLGCDRIGIKTSDKICNLAAAARLTVPSISFRGKFSFRRRTESVISDHKTLFAASRSRNALNGENDRPHRRQIVTITTFGATFDTPIYRFY